MPRYIDADAVNKVFIDELGKIPSVVIDERIEWYIECDATKQTIIRCVKGVSAIPTADVVEVVRCEYCKHWNESDCHSTVIPIVRKCMCMNVYTNPDFFCKYGERREDVGKPDSDDF